MEENNNRSKKKNTRRIKRKWQRKREENEKNREKVKEERKIWRTYFTDILKLFLFLTLRRIVNITENPNFFIQVFRPNHLQHSYDFFTFSNL